MAGWEVLRAEYFADTAVAVLASLFEPEGFRTVADREGRERVVFENGTCSLHFTYWWEDSPDYCVMIGVTPAEACPVSFDEFGLWFAVPDGHPFRKGQYCRFHSPEELRSVLTKIFNEVILVHAKPLWSDPRQLEGIARKFAQQQQR